jgi:hypothetical protein
LVNKKKQSERQVFADKLDEIGARFEHSSRKSFSRFVQATKVSKNLRHERPIKCAVRFTPRPLLSTRKKPQVSTDEEAGWAPEPVWTLWRSEKYISSGGYQTPAVQPVAHHYTGWVITSDGKILDSKRG